MKIIRPKTPHLLSPHLALTNPTKTHHYRTFLTPPTQTLTATRTLPFASPQIYAIISDIESYSAFLPYCLNSSITRWSRPDKTGKKWPSEAQLRIGFKGFEETFTSRVYCVPGRIVEAVGGKSRTRLKKEDLSHYDKRDVAEEFGFGSGGFGGNGENGNGILTHLLTRWTVRPFPFRPSAETGSVLDGNAHVAAESHTEVHLAIEYQFSNPIYSAMSGAVADGVVGVMIEAFEKRVKDLLDGEVANGTSVQPRENQ